MSQRTRNGERFKRPGTSTTVVNRAELLSRLDAERERADEAEARAQLLAERCQALYAQSEGRVEPPRERLEQELTRTQQERLEALERLDAATRELVRMSEERLDDQQVERLKGLLWDAELGRAAAERQAEELGSRLGAAEQGLKPPAGVHRASSGGPPVALLPQPAAEPTPAARKRTARRRTTLPVATAGCGLVIGLLGGALALGENGGPPDSPRAIGPQERVPDAPPAAPAPAPAPASAPAPAVAAERPLPDCRAGAGTRSPRPVVCATRTAVLTIVNSRRPLVLPGLHARVLAARVEGQDVAVVARLRNVTRSPQDVVNAARGPHLSVAGERQERIAPPGPVSALPGEATTVQLRFRLDAAALRRLPRTGADLGVSPPVGSAPGGRGLLGVVRLRPAVPGRG